VVQSKNKFLKLLGSGKNGFFDKSPDWQQWGILTVHDSLMKIFGPTHSCQNPH
jgi:hypothetical protein